MNENLTMKEIMLAVSKHFPRITKLFRNNTGQGWVGKTKHCKDYIIIKEARPLHAGLCEGSSDLIGWTEIKITPEMIGQSVAVFTAIEVKAPRGVASKKQKHFLKVVQDAGGISGIARNEEEFVNVIGSKLALSESKN